MARAFQRSDNADESKDITSCVLEEHENPRCWKTHKKWTTTVVVSLSAFISPVASTMIAPALPSMAQDFHTTAAVQRELMLSIFVLAYAFGPLLFGPLSELYGRRVVLQSGFMFFLAFNLSCGFAKTRDQIIAFRFLAGFGGSVPLSVGAAILGDIWHPHQRGRAVALYSLMPFLGPAIGPIAGAFLSEYSTWRWCFWATSIACGLVQGVSWFFLPETYAPELLRRKSGGHVKSISKHISAAMRRPFRLLLTQPIVQVLTLYLAYLFGLMYLMLASFPVLWTSSSYYNESLSIGSLNYISLGVGLFLGAQSAAPLNDAIFSRLTASNRGVSKPEFRVPLMVPGSILVPVGLFWYGWAARAHTHWIVPNLGAAIFAFGVVVAYQCIQTYLIDAYTRHSASALAASVFLRSLCGFGFPLFAPYLQNALGYGWTATLLGLIATVVGIPVPILLWKFGSALRTRGGYSSDD